MKLAVGRIRGTGELVSVRANGSSWSPGRDSRPVIIGGMVLVSAVWQDGALWFEQDGDLRFMDVARVDPLNEECRALLGLRALREGDDVQASGVAATRAGIRRFRA